MKHVVTYLLVLCCLVLAVSCKKEVVDSTIHVTGVSLDATSVTLTVGESFLLSATVSPNDADNRLVSWSSSDASVATVQSGNVSAKSEGTATITVTTEDGNKSATCKVTVKSKTVSVTSVSLDKASAEVYEGETLTLTATVNPSDATNKKVTWSSSDKDVAMVDAEGQAVALKVGTATITVTTEDENKSATCKVTVKSKTVSVTSVSLDKASAEVYEGETLTLTATVNPSNATNKNVTWSSSNTSVATVDANGKVTALKAGSAAITVKTNDGGKSANCQVDVSSVDGYDFYKTCTSVKIGGSVNISRMIVLMPCPATNEYQDIINLKVDKGIFCDAKVSETVLYYETNSMPGSSIEVSETFGFKSKKVLIDFEKSPVKNIHGNVSPKNYLDSDGTYIDLDNRTIKEISTSLWVQSTGVIDYARKCYEYVAKNFDYICGSWRSLSKILEEGGGECGDFSTVFVNLMRCQKIPARHNIGVWKTGGYHVWPDFYDEDFGWIPLDPTFKHSNPASDYFGRYDGDLIIVSQGLTSFSTESIRLVAAPLQTYHVWWWKSSGSGDPSCSFNISPY